MKKIFLILIIISCHSCNNNNYLISKLTLDCPKELQDYKNENTDSELKFTQFETGLDSLTIFFGSKTKNNKTDYWISSNFKGSNSLQEILLTPIDSLKFLSQDITLEINPFDPISHYKISLRVLHSPLENTVQYIWLKNDISYKTASLIKVVHPIQQEKLFPQIIINYVSGETISTNDFKDKIVIINWWSTSCTPCVKEIPELNKIAEKYKSNENILFLAITNDKRDRVKIFLEKYEFKYNQGLVNKDVNKIFLGFQPQNIIINKDGITKLFLAGYMEQTPMIIEKTIEHLLLQK